MSPDERTLFVTETLRNRIWSYRVLDDGSLTDANIFHDMGGGSVRGAGDGLKVDRTGNVYSTGPGGLWIFSPAGEHIGSIRTPEPLTNLAFGGADGRTLFLSSAQFLYRLPTKTFGPMRRPATSADN